MNVQIAQTYTVYCATELLDLFGDRKQMHGRYAHMLWFCSTELSLWSTKNQAGLGADTLQNIVKILNDTLTNLQIFW